MRTRDRITRHARPRVPAKSRSWKRKQVGCHRAAVCNFLQEATVLFLLLLPFSSSSIVSFEEILYDRPGCMDDSWRRRRRGFGRKYDGERSNLFVSLEKGRMMRLLGRRRNDDVLGSDATSPSYLTRQFLFESYFPTLAFECSSCNSAGTRELSNVGRVR